MLALRTGGHRELERLYSAFELDFDRRELLPKLAIHKAMLRGDMELLLVYDEDSESVVAYALSFCRSVYGYVLLKYFGVLPWFREKGMGVQAMRLLHRYYADRQGILAELTVFDPEDEGQTMKKLQKFFGRFGYEPLPCRYTIGGAPVELRLKQIKGKADLGPVIHRVIYDFYDRCLGPVAQEKMLDVRPAETEE